MPIVYTYPTVSPTNADLLLLSDVSDPQKRTKSAVISDVVALATAIIIPEVTVSTTYGGGTYTGAASGVTSLDMGTVYIVTFDVTNAVSPVYLDINGTGSYPLQEGSESGWVDIPINGLLVGITYFLQWDGDRFQVYETNPESSSTVEFVNPDPVTATHGGITVGQTFARKDDDTGYSMQEMFDMILYPYQSPALSSLGITGQGPTVEVGYTVPSGAKTFTWSRSNAGNIEANSGVITDTTAGTTLATGVPIKSATSDSVALPLSIQKTSGGATHKWQIAGTNSQGGSLPTSAYTITWKWKWFWGTNASLTIGVGDITSLGSSALSTSSSGSNTWAAGDYKYLVMPSSFPEPSTIKDSATNLGIGMAGVAEGYTLGAGTYKYSTVTTAVPNAYGVLTTYRIYRTKNALGGAVSFIIS